ncbi:hypothetical protein C0993_009467 [Termitomyces sp. T159_Od127]|nr:hypothetical protein C0993_009467 [Termitomyces sp. T159_Od127]
MHSSTTESLSNLHPDSSPFSSPVRKRQRLSSPTYDEQLVDFNQADFDALEQLDAHSSQSPRKNSSQTEELPRHHSLGQNHPTSFDDHIDFLRSQVILDGVTSRKRHTIELTNDPENPFTTPSNVPTSFIPVSAQTFASASALTNSSTTPIVGFSKASALDVNEVDISDDFHRSSSPEEPPNQDYDAWFEPAGAIPPITFQSASSSLLTPAGFMKASNKGFIAPSSAALAKAQAKMRDIWQESDSLDPSTPSIRNNPENIFQPASSLSTKSPRRPALQPVVNSPGIGSPSTPSPAGFSRPLTKPSSTMTPTELFISRNSKPFKSPLLAKKAGTSTSMESPRSTLTTPYRLGVFATTKAQHPLAAAPITADFPSITRNMRKSGTDTKDISIDWSVVSVLRSSRPARMANFPLDAVEHIYDELEDPAEAPKVIAGLGRNECASLARLIRNRLNRDKTHAIQDMEVELQDICPPRVVKSFRIIVVQDACTRKYPGNRKALLNVWDVLDLSFCEGSSPGSFEIGQRFMITNLKPTHQKSWMGQEPGAEVYLCTGQHSRWTPIRT